MRTEPMLVAFCVGMMGMIPLAGAQEAKLLEGPGLAAKYPGDRGIARDPNVLFAEDFATGSLEEVGKRWGGEVGNPGGKVPAFSADVPTGSASRRSLQMTATRGENEGGSLYAPFSPGVDTAFARFYVKFPRDAEYIHHFVWLGGLNPPTTYPQSHAGERPNGDDRLSIGIEPTGVYGRYPAPGVWNFYNYWVEMKRSSDGHYWGNSITPAQPAVVPRERWQCVEIMVKCNSAPERHDGALALWLDGKLILYVAKGVRRGPWTGEGFALVEQGGEPFEGFRWRTSSDLKLNFFRLLYYVTDDSSRQNRVVHPKPTNRVWFANIVVSRTYIGPLQPSRAGKNPASKTIP